MARTVRMAQSLGFSLREIAALNVEYQAKRMTPARGAEVLCAQLGRLEEKATHVNAMIRYIKAKLAWMETGGKGTEPNFTDYEQTSRRIELTHYNPKRGKATRLARRSFRKYEDAPKVPAK